MESLLCWYIGVSYCFLQTIRITPVLLYKGSVFWHGLEESVEIQSSTRDGLPLITVVEVLMAYIPYSYEFCFPLTDYRGMVCCHIIKVTVIILTHLYIQEYILYCTVQYKLYLCQVLYKTAFVTHSTYRDSQSTVLFILEDTLDVYVCST